MKRILSILLLLLWVGCSAPAPNQQNDVPAKKPGEKIPPEQKQDVPPGNLLPAKQPANEVDPKSGQSSTTPANPKPNAPYSTQTQVMVSPLPKITNHEFSQGWPSFRGNALANGVASSTLPEPTKLEVLWKHKVPKGEFQSTACLVPLKGRAAAVVGDMDGLILAIDLESGDVLWSFKIKFGYACSIAFFEDHIYVGNIDGRFLCLDSGGKLKWEFSAGSEIDGSATFYEDQVLFTSQDAKLYSLRRSTGELAWSIEAGDQLRCAPVIADGQVFLAGCDALLRGIQLSDQTNTMEVPIDSPTGCTPAISGDVIYFGTEQAGFKAVDIRKKELAWSFDDQGRSLAFRGNAATIADLVIVGDNARNVWALQADTGEVKWSTPLRAIVETSPVIVGDFVYVASGDGRLSALKVQTGELVWEKEFSGQFKSSPAVGFGRLVISSDDGTIYCLGAKD
ncbi:MAG: PQQ-binding-like beta-propeller repeat protein [Pirellulaceae bacterium]